MVTPQSPYRLVTVNNGPDRAKRLVGRVIERLNAQDTIVHVANAENPESARQLFEKVNPDLVFAASMWSTEQSQYIFAQAHEVNPNIKTLAIPPGLQVERGPDAVVDWLLENLPKLLVS